MPARNNPVKNLNTNNDALLWFPVISPRLVTAPASAQIKKTFDGEKRSDIVSNADNNVPTINPSWTADVRLPSRLSPRWNSFKRSCKTAFPANQSDTHA